MVCSEGELTAEDRLLDIIKVISFFSNVLPNIWRVHSKKRAIQPT